MALGNLGVPVGTEFVLLFAGGMAQNVYHSNWLAVGAVATTGEMFGAFVCYAIGYYGGRPFVARYGKFVKLSEAKLDKFHEFYERHGAVVVFVCRFIPMVRGVSSLPAGVSRMQKRYFVLYTLLGSLPFCLGLAALGSVFSRHLDRVGGDLHRAVYAILAVVLVVVAGYALWRWQAGRRRAAP